MSLWFKRTRGLDTDVMAQIATDAGVGWDAKPVSYRKDGIGWEQADSSDVTAIKDAAESLLGYRPVEIDEPTVEDQM